MEEEFDFEKHWLEKFSRSLCEIVGEEIRIEVMKGSEMLSVKSTRKEVIEWSGRAMSRLDSFADEEKRRDIMTACACQYPVSDLEDARHLYEETGSLDASYDLLQRKFLSFLKDTLKLEDGLIGEIVGKGWGIAGIRKGKTIIATKMPKSGDLRKYMKEKDPVRKRALYCHCPRIRDSIISGTRISPTYCYCGAGFYKKIWEHILQKQVKVEVLESVLKGGDVCRIAIYLPHG